MRVQSMKSIRVVCSTLGLFCFASPAPAQVITEFPILDVSDPTAMTRGPDGNLWFTVSGEYGDAKIGRVTPSGVVSMFPLPGVRGVQGIAAGPDGNLWFTESTGNKIGRMTTSGEYVEFAVPTPGAQPWGVSPGPDGNIWFTERGAGQIGKVTLNDVDPRTLRLGGNRYHVEAYWFSPPDDGYSDGWASAVPVSLTSDAGYFWFSDPANVELVVKILDWCPAGGVKFFAAGLTNLRAYLTVTDTKTGISRMYVNPQGAAFQPIEDDFPACTPSGNVAGAWTGTWNHSAASSCDPSTNLPAQADFDQDGSVVRGTLSTASVECGWGALTFQGTLLESVLSGHFKDDEGLRFHAVGTLLGGSLDVTIDNGSDFVVGQLHLHR